MVKLTPKNRIFKCSYGNTIDKYINAAINITAKSICGTLQRP